MLEEDGAAVGLVQLLHTYTIQIRRGQEMEDMTLHSDPANAFGYCLGNTLWSAAPVLIDYLTTCADDALVGKHCLELGCGLGAVGMAAAMHGAAEVLLTDMPQMQRLLQLNISSNMAKFPASTRVHSAVLDWRTVETSRVVGASTCRSKRSSAVSGPQDDSACTTCSSWDVVLAADVVYDERLFEPLWRTLEAVADHETVIYLALPNRESEAGTSTADHDELSEPCTDLDKFLSMAPWCNEIFDCTVRLRRAYEPQQSVVHIIEVRRQSKA